MTVFTGKINAYRDSQWHIYNRVPSVTFFLPRKVVKSWKKMSKPNVFLFYPHVYMYVMFVTSTSTCTCTVYGHKKLMYMYSCRCTCMCWQTWIYQELQLTIEYPAPSCLSLPTSINMYLHVTINKINFILIILLWWYSIEQ